jgi:hypothetical protein
MLLKCPVARYIWSVVDKFDIPTKVEDICTCVKSFTTIEIRQLVASGVSAIF